MALDRLTQVTSSGITTTISFRSSGINVSGAVTASSFVGDGSGLTGVVGSGSGVVILDGGSTVGTAATINFGSNLSVSPISGGIVTVTASGGSSGLSNIVEDTTPQLGGNLDINGFNIVSVRSNENINIVPNGTGSVVLDGDVTITGTLSGGSPLTLGNGVDFDSNDITNLGTLNTHTVPGGTGTLALTSDITFTASSTDTLTNKTINSASNTITITESNISDLGSYITASSIDTLTNKSIALGSNTVTGTVLNIGADDSTLRAVGVGEGIKIIGGTNVTTSSDSEGNITVNSSASGDVADDTTPQLGGDLDLNGHSITTARSNEDLNLTPNGTGTVTINGGLKLEEGTQEKFSSLTSATGTVTHDCSNGNIFYHTSISADFTANFTNLQLDSSYATTVTLVLVQGASEFIPTAVQVAGAAQTINWQGGLEPTGTDNGIDIVSFTILNNSGTYTVLGQLVDF